MYNLVAQKPTKAEIVGHLARQVSLPQRKVQEVVDGFMEYIKHVLITQGSVELRGFGSFAVKVRKGRTVAFNPANPSVTFPIEDHGVVVFRPGQELKREVWKIQ